MLQLNNLNVTGKSKFSNDASFNGVLDTTGQIIIRETTQPSVIYMRLNYEPSLYGFCFTDETPGRIMNFRVKNANGIGYKLFYFASSQLYASMLTYIDNWLTVSYNNQFVMGDANNAGVWNGSAMKYVPNSAETSGLVIFNKGLNNNTAYYTNFTHNNLSNVEVPTMRMNYNNIWSKVKHTFELDASMNANLNVSGTSTLNGLNAQATSLSSLTVTGNILCAGLTASGNANIQGNLTVNSGTINNIGGLTTFSGNVTVNNLLSINTPTTGFSNALTLNNNITQTGYDASHNKITQNIISNDITGNQNIFKYSEFSFNNSGNSTPYPLITYRETTSDRGIWLFPKLRLNDYNTLIQESDAAIISKTAVSPDNSALSLSVWGTIKSGIRISNPTSTTANVELYCKNSYIKMNSSSVLQSLDISSEILTHTATSGYQLTSPEVFLQTTNDLYPCKYRALTHEFSKKDGTSGCILDVKGSIKFPSGQSQTDAWNSTNAGYTKSGSTLSFANNTNLTLTTGGFITFPDSTTQSTAYTTADDTKLNAIGTIINGSISVTTTLTTGAFFNAGSISITTTGTYIVSVNACVSVITGTTAISQILAGLSTSTTTLSQSTSLGISHLGNSTAYPVGAQWIIHNSNTFSLTGGTTYYMLVQCSFATASRLQFVGGNSSFSATRIA